MPLLGSESGLRIGAIYTYPIKALRAVQLDSAQVTEHGLMYDRHFMLVEVVRKADGSTEHKNVAVADYPESVRFFPSISTSDDGSGDGTLTVTHRPLQGVERTLEIPLLPCTAGLEIVDTIMHGSPTPAFRMITQYSDWFSECYGKEMVLVYLGHHRRSVLMSSKPFQLRHAAGAKARGDAGWFSGLSSIASSATNYLTGKPAVEEVAQPTITFTDCAPFLVVSEKSMEDLQHRLPDGHSMDIIKFRPNIVVCGAADVWEEDFWGELVIGGTTKIECIHNCGRCKSINIDYDTGKPGLTATGQMLKLMQRDRRVDPGMKYSPIFGRYAFLHAESEDAVIRTGGQVVVSKRNDKRSIFDWEGISTYT